MHLFYDRVRDRGFVDSLLCNILTQCDLVMEFGRCPSEEYGMDHFLNVSSMRSLNEFCSSLRAGQENSYSVVSLYFLDRDCKVPSDNCGFGEEE